MLKARMERVMASLDGQGLTQVLISDPLSIFYLTGYLTEPHERFFGLVLARTGDGVTSTLFANALFPDPAGAADAVVRFSDTDDVTPLVAHSIDASAPLGVDKDLAARWLVPLIDSGAAREVRLGSFAVDEARSVKDDVERELMRVASRLNDRGMDWLAASLHVGVTEAQVAQDLFGAYRALGADGFSFDPIVSFGATAADPHHEPDATALAPGDMVLFDVGCRKDLYCADMTRTFFTARPTKRQLLVYDTVRRANEAAEALVRPGVRFCDLDRCARTIIEDAGFGPYFTHRLGHQIGLSVHEPGDVSATHDEEVAPGNVFSIEPGIYLPGEIGVRIEDLVLVTEDGAEILNAYTHEPTILTL
jgi:Xaa-Pro dipeptidase